MDDKILFVTQAARILGCSVDSVRRYAEAGKLAFTRSDGGTRIFRESDVRALAAEMRRAPAKTAKGSHIQKTRIAS
jgi:excisionase family DNA binding protein